jgi:tRNA(fMet)-specific endonuclease VapC
VLDTGVLINAVRRRLDLAELIAHDDVALPAIVLTEYLEGIERDPDHARRSVQRAFLEVVLTTTPVADYTAKIVPHHVALLSHTRRIGLPRGAVDLMVAATALGTERCVLTTDAKARFDELPGVSCRVIQL